MRGVVRTYREGPDGRRRRGGPGPEEESSERPGEARGHPTAGHSPAAERGPPSTRDVGPPAHVGVGDNGNRTRAGWCETPQQNRAPTSSPPEIPGSRHPAASRPVPSRSRSFRRSKRHTCNMARQLSKCLTPAGAEFVGRAQSFFLRDAIVESCKLHHGRLLGVSDRLNTALPTRTALGGDLRSRGARPRQRFATRATMAIPSAWPATVRRWCAP